MPRSRPNERQLDYWDIVRRHATPDSERYRERVKVDVFDNPLVLSVFKIGNARMGQDPADGIMKMWIRCNCCGKQKEARRWNFKPNPRMKSGFESTCNKCRSQRQGSRQWMARNHPNVAYHRTRAGTS